MANTLEQRACANHPDRPGAALCMTCRKVVCQECATPWEGINYCVDCLAARRTSERRRAGSPVWVLWAAAAAGLFWLTTHLRVWAIVILSQIFDGF